MKVISRKLVRKAIEMINNLAKVDSDNEDDEDDDEDEDDEHAAEDSDFEGDAIELGEVPPSNIRRRRRAVWKELEDTFFTERSEVEEFLRRQGFSPQGSILGKARVETFNFRCTLMKRFSCDARARYFQQSAPGAGGVNSEWTLQMAYEHDHKPAKEKFKRGFPAAVQDAICDAVQQEPYIKLSRLESVLGSKLGEACPQMTTEMRKKLKNHLCREKARHLKNFSAETLQQCQQLYIT